MWTRAYLVLVAVRLYFALSPSYIHPDENFQGPEVIAGNIFDFPHHLTWEFSAAEPVRSVFPLWPAYGLPMVILRWLWTETGKEEVAPKIIYYTLRVVMFIASFVLEDWAIHELVPSPRQRRIAIILVASSYVTWTYQTHTFSNSIETIVVLWSLVLIQRILDDKQRSSVFTSGVLGSLVVFGVFNRITFPTFVLAPGLYLLPHFSRKPFSLISMLVSIALTTLLAVHVDNHFYHPSVTLFSTITSLLKDPLPLLTPYNLLRYNLRADNLTLHGIHPRWTHLLVNLPILLGPSLLLLLTHPLPSPLLLSAITSIALLSLIPHQEPRFLLPAIPLLLSSIHSPRSRRARRLFSILWGAFNLAMGVIFGIYHQGGVVGMQTWLGEHTHAAHLAGLEALWWRTYSPPIWLLDGAGLPAGLRTTNLMGLPFANLTALVDGRVAACASPSKWAPLTPAAPAPAAVVVVAPRSSRELDAATAGQDARWAWEPLWTEWRHVNLDDLDVGREGVVGTLGRVVGRRGLTAWKVRRRC